MSSALSVGTIPRPGAERGALPAGDVDPGRFSYNWLFAILLVAFLLRLGFMLKLTPVISGDGCEYVRMAMEIRDGKPLTGVFDWPETMYGTLYPVLIAETSRLGMSAEHAAELLSLVFGTGLVLVAFFLALRVYGKRVAYLAATLFALFPLFVSLSGSIYNETVYLTLWLAGIYWLIRALDTFSPANFLLTGILFGLATLSRPEAFAYVLFAVAATAIVGFLRRVAWSKAIKGVALLLGAWFVLMVPYALFQHAHTGQYRFEGKWNINYTLGNRINAGMGYIEAGFTVDNKLNVPGPLLESNRFAAYTPYSHSMRDQLVYFGRVIRRNWPDTYDEIFLVDFGGPVMVLLIALGLFGTEWSLERLRREFVLVVMGLSIVVVMVTAAHLEHRYSYPLPVIMLLWAAAGLDVFSGWTRRTLISWGEAFQPAASWAGEAAVAVLLFSLLTFAFVGVRTDHYFTMEQQGLLGIKQAGLWLGAQAPEPQRICAFEGRVAYYSGATLVTFPYADPDTTLRYLRSKQIEYVVLDSQNMHALPTLAQWFVNGIPDPRAHLVYESTEGNEDRVKVFRWDNSVATANLLASGPVKELSR